MPQPGRVSSNPLKDDPGVIGDRYGGGCELGGAPMVAQKAKGEKRGGLEVGKDVAGQGRWR